MKKENQGFWTFLAILSIIVAFIIGVQLGLKNNAKKHQTEIAEIKKELAKNDEIIAEIIVGICAQYPEVCKSLPPAQAQKRAVEKI